MQYRSEGSHKLEAYATWVSFQLSNAAGCSLSLLEDIEKHWCKRLCFRTIFTDK